MQYAIVLLAGAERIIEFVVSNVYTICENE